MVDIHVKCRTYNVWEPSMDHRSVWPHITFSSDMVYYSHYHDYRYISDSLFCHTYIPNFSALLLLLYHTSTKCNKINIDRGISVLTFMNYAIRFLWTMLSDFMNYAIRFIVIVKETYHDIISIYYNIFPATLKEQITRSKVLLGRLASVKKDLDVGIFIIVFLMQGNVRTWPTL